MAGAGLYLTTVLATIILGVLYSLSFMLIFKPTDRYLLVVKVNRNSSNIITDKMKDKKKCVLKTESVKEDIVEFTYEVCDKSIADEILAWKDSNIKCVNLVNII